MTSTTVPSIPVPRTEDVRNLWVLVMSQTDRYSGEQAAQSFDSWLNFEIAMAGGTADPKHPEHLKSVHAKVLDQLDAHNPICPCKDWSHDPHDVNPPCERSEHAWSIARSL